MLRNSCLTLRAFVLVILASMTSTADAQSITLTGDLDGIPGNEIVVAAGNTVTLTYPKTGKVQKITVANFYNNVLLVDLNALAGNEILLTGRITINGYPSNSPIASVINPIQNTIIAYNVGPWSDFLLGELNGAAGTDLVFHDAGDLFGGGNVTLLMRQSGVIQTFPFTMPGSSFNNLQLVDLNAVAGDEILLTERITIGGGPANSQTVIVIDPVQNSLRYFNVGFWTGFQISELNGQAGSEVIFDNREGIFAGNSVSVLMRASGALSVFPYTSLPHFNSLQIANLDGQAGANILLTNNFSIDGFPNNGAVVSVVTPRTNTLQNYQIGSWRSYSLGNVDGFPGLEVIFTMTKGLPEVLDQRLGEVIGPFFGY